MVFIPRTQRCTWDVDECWLPVGGCASFMQRDSVVHGICDGLGDIFLKAGTSFLSFTDIQLIADIAIYRAVYGSLWIVFPVDRHGFSGLGTEDTLYTCLRWPVYHRFDPGK